MRTIIQTVTGQTESSLDFYAKLGFEIEKSEVGFWLMDASVTLWLNTSFNARPGSIFIKDDWSPVIPILKDRYCLLQDEKGYKLGDGNGNWIYLYSDQTLGQVPASDCRSILGNYAGISIECADIENSLSLYELFGFKKSSGSIEQGWISLVQGNTIVSLMTPGSCPHLFFNPSVTYFNGAENISVIEAVRKSGVPIAQEITHFNKSGIVDNIILSDPGHLGFFIYND